MIVGEVRSRTHTGEGYVAHITSSAEDRRTRAAFHALVPRLVAPGARLFDFGAGPGLDALHFAALGFRVHAFDPDPEMRRSFLGRCAAALADGSIRLEGGEYPEFLGRSAPELDGTVDLVIANFAPLNLIEDLVPLFARLARLTHARGRVLASVINPFFWDEMRHRWWWGRLPELARTGRYFMPGPIAPHFRRAFHDLARGCAPAFTLTRVYPGAPVRHAGGFAYPPGRGLALLRGRFVFVLFEKPRVEDERC